MAIRVEALLEAAGHRATAVRDLDRVRCVVIAHVPLRACGVPHGQYLGLWLEGTPFVADNQPTGFLALHQSVVHVREPLADDTGVIHDFAQVAILAVAVADQQRRLCRRRRLFLELTMP